MGRGEPRIYVTGGDGSIGVFEQSDADHYTDMGRIPSAPGAKMAILVPYANRSISLHHRAKRPS